VCVCGYVTYCYHCLSVTSVSCAKMTQLTDTLFGPWTPGGHSNHVLGGGLDPPPQGTFGVHLYDPILTFSMQCSSVVCSFCAIAAAVPPRPQDGTVSVIVLFTIVSSCATDCNFVTPRLADGRYFQPNSLVGSSNMACDD